MTGRRYNLANGDVSKVFKAPQDIVNAVDVPTDKKIELLRDWEMDLREVLVASEEGMNSKRQRCRGSVAPSPPEPGQTWRIRYRNARA